MEMMREKQKAISRYQDLKICLIGEEWTGKSSAGNTILGQTVFKVDSDTEHVAHSYRVIGGKKVIIVDTPGWDSECSPYVPLKMLKKGLTSTLTCQGFHVLLLTIPISQSQEWNQKFANRLLNALRLFTDDIWKHTMLLFTRSDLLHLTGFEGYLKGSGWPLQSLVEKCEHRCHVINNCQQYDDKQVRELLEKIEQMVQDNKGQSLQVKSKQKVGMLREHDMGDSKQLVEIYSKMEEHPGSESCFMLNDYVFKSLKPEENDSPNPSEQSELPEQNSTYAWPPKSEMSHAVEMQDAACEYIHIQDQDTESTHDLCLDNSADMNKDLAICSDEDGDIEMSGVDWTEQNTWTEVEAEAEVDRIPRALEKKEKQFILPKITPQTWDISCGVNLTCHIYRDVSDQQYVLMTCVLQVSGCWRKMEPSCLRDWISFTMCADDIIWLFIIILYLFVKTVCMIYRSFGVSKEAGNQVMNANGFVQLQQEWSKDNRGGFQPLLWHNKPKNLDEETQCSMLEDDKEILQCSAIGHNEEMKKDEDEKLGQQSQKGEEEYELHQLKEKEGQEGELEQEITQQCKKDEDDELTQHIHICEEEYELPQHSQEGEQEQEITQQCKKDDDDLTQHIHICEEEYELPQHSQEGEQEQEITQQCKKGEDDEITQHIHICEDDCELPQHSQNKEEKKEDDIPQHSQNEDREKEEEEEEEKEKEEQIQEQELQQKTAVNEEILHLSNVSFSTTSKSGDKAKPQHDCNDDGKNIFQQGKRVDNVQTLQYIIKEDEKQILQNIKGDYEETEQQRNADEREELLKPSRMDVNMSQNDNRQEGCQKIDERTKIVDYEKRCQHSRKADKKGISQCLKDDKEIPQNKCLGDDKDIPQYNCLGDDKAIPLCNWLGDDTDIPQCNCLRDDKDISQCNCLGDDKDIPQYNCLGDDKEIPQCNCLGDYKEIPQCNCLGDDKEISPCKWLGDDLEIPQNKRDRNNEDISKHSSRSDNEDIHQHKRNRNDGDTFQQLMSAPDNVKIPRHNRRELDDEIPQHVWRGNKKDVNQHISVEDTGTIKEAPGQQVGGTVRHNCCRNQEIDDDNNISVVRKAEKTLDVRREKFRGTRKITRSQSMDLLIKLRHAEDETSQHRRCQKFRTRSLERFIVFNR